jgi:hypothetical protein
MASVKRPERSHAGFDELKGVTYSTVGDEAGSCGGETMDSVMKRSGQVVGGIQTGAMIIDGNGGNGGNDGISVYGRQMQHEAAAALTSWTSRSFSCRALQQLVTL